MRKRANGNGGPSNGGCESRRAGDGPSWSVSWVRGGVADLNYQPRGSFESCRLWGGMGKGIAVF